MASLAFFFSGCQHGAHRWPNGQAGVATLFSPMTRHSDEPSGFRFQSFSPDLPSSAKGGVGRMAQRDGKSRELLHATSAGRTAGHAVGLLF